MKSFPVILFLYLLLSTATAIAVTTPSTSNHGVVKEFVNGSNGCLPGVLMLLMDDDSFTIEIHINTNGSDLGSFNMFLDFPQATVSINTSRGETGLEKGADTSGYHTLLSNPADIANGHYRFAAMTADGYANGADVHIATIHATASGTIPDALEFNVRINEAVDELGQAITAPVDVTIVVP